MSPLITAVELVALSDARLTELPLVVLDVRWRLGGPPGLLDYQAAHVPGARFLNLDTALADPPGPGGRHPIPDPARLTAEFASVGVSDSSTVVVYDDADGSVAARAWWLLRWLGMPSDQVRVLDGGFSAWVADGHPTESEVPEPTRGALTARPGSMPVLDADGAASLAGTGLLLDARAPARYRGETEPVDPRAGHVPGARNAPFARHIGPEGHWRSPDDLAAYYRALGVVGGTEVGAYCGSGVTATSVVLALEHAGLRPPERPAALYAGSWSNWSADPERPVALGDEPEPA
ncbi:sulfurtransferase [Pseudonocardia spinosispora]|uniref:sulfurtransferase n=1 Tax=Pseudonocardia spinosispora TaxID=103441 RepID=UPI00048BCBEB|nr:sulfurtransferase [Pseudonocardia spinosispora]